MAQLIPGEAVRYCKKKRGRLKSRDGLFFIYKKLTKILYNILFICLLMCNLGHETQEKRACCI